MRWLMILALAGLAFAAIGQAGERRPAETPPADFPGRQYIDSTGCAFLRDEAGRWNVRLAGDGTVLCGFPPSNSIRGVHGRPRLRALAPDAVKKRAQLVQEKLATKVFTELRPGELVTDDRPMEQLPDMGPEHADSAPLDALKASLERGGEIRKAMGRDLKPNQRLCRLLGHDGRAAGNGHDPTQGYCDGLSDLDLSRLTLIRPVAIATDSGSDAAPPDGQGLGQIPAPAKAAVTPAKSRKPARVAKPAAPRPGAAPQRADRDDPAMLPAGARHIQIAIAPDPQAFEQTARRIAGLGYPVARGRLRDGVGKQVVLAGPFATREAIVRALHRLRQAGFTAAVPR